MTLTLCYSPSSFLLSSFSLNCVQETRVTCVAFHPSNGRHSKMRPAFDS